MPPSASYRLFALLLLSSVAASAQCPQAGFTLPDTVCVNESISISNTTTGATQYAWDFCSGDLMQNPALQEITTLPNAAIPTDITTVSDGTNWYSFVSSRDNNKIFRLDYGNSLNNTPTISDLGNPGGLLSRPEQMKIVKEGTEWIGLVVNLNNFSNNYSVTRLEFGNSLTNVPGAVKITELSTYLQLPRGIEIVQDDLETVVLIANTVSNVVTVANFGSSLKNPLLASNIKTVPLPNATSGHNVMGILVIRQCNQWFGVAVSYANRVFQLNFGDKLFAVPSVSEITASRHLNLSPVKVALLNDAGMYQAVIMHADGKVVQLTLGNNLLASSPVLNKTFNRVGDAVGMELVCDQSVTSLFTVDWASKKVFRFLYSENCSVNGTPPISPAQSPAALSYTTGGMKYITLTASDTNGNVNVFTDSVFVRPSVTPGFAAEKRCEGSSTQFTANAAPAGNRITSWAWNFGDGNNATDASPTHTYAASGTYSVSLATTDACGNMQTVTQTVAITKKNTPYFTAPATVCSNTDITFQDTSVSVDDEITAWQWNFGDGAMANEPDPKHAFATAGTFNITLLITGKSGCSESITKAMVVKEGAAVNFAVENACFGESTQFTDQTTFGNETNVSTRQWNFGDGTTSGESNPVHQYANPGEYTVTLTIQNDQGCTTSQEQQITIRKLPQANFSYSLACAGNGTLFTDESTAESSNLTDWQWDFGDLASGAGNQSAEQHPTHVFSAPGTYQVRLQAETNYGCVHATIRTVNVIASPEARFSFEKTCGSKQVIFTDQSVAKPGNLVTGWYWNFGDGTTSAAQHPEHTYGQPGDYTVELITTAESRCTGSFRQLIQITESQPPTVTIAVQGNLCAGSTLTFAGETSNGNDPVIEWQWNFGAFGTSAEAQPSLNISSAATFDAQLTITTQAGCTATTSKTIQVNALPQADFSYQAISERTPFQLDFTGTRSSEITATTWDFGDGNTSSQLDPSHTYAQSGVYTVRLTATNSGGCSVTVEKQITISRVSSAYALKLEEVQATTVDQTMQLQVRLFNGSAITIRQLTFTTALDGQDATTQVWNGNFLPGTELIYTYTRAMPGTFFPRTVCVTAQDAENGLTSNRQCRSVDDTYVLLEPYPNPATQKVTVPVWIPRPGKVSVVLFNALGQEVLVFPEKSLQAGFNEIPGDVRTLGSGLYYLRCNAGGQIQTKKLVIR